MEYSLSRGGRLLLVNSVLTSLPLYFMSFFYLPQWVVDHIDRLRRAFFWIGESNVTGGQCLVNWEVLCSPRGSGGLGIRRLRDFNISLLSKLWWKLLTNHSSPWVKVVLHNYYYRGRPLDLYDKIPERVSPFWRGVLKTTNAFKIRLRIFCWQGTTVEFWKDCWFGEVPLSLAFPNLFDMVADKDVWISSQIQDNDWAIFFHYPLTPTRLQMLAVLMEVLKGQHYRMLWTRWFGGAVP